MATPEVQRLLDVHTSLIFDSKTQKIKCSLTNHQMPAKASAIESYVSGKKYKRLASFNTFAYEEHKEHLVQNRKKENELFCNLTLRHLEKTAKAIQRHITGRKYKNALAKWEECQKTGTTFTPNNQRKAKAPEQTNDDDDDDDKKDGDDNKDEGKSDEEEDEDVGSDGTIVEDESTDDEDEDDVVDDDMSDLYPAADFPELNDEDDEEEKENEVEESEDDDEEEEEDEESEEEEVVIKSKKSGAQKRSNKSTNGQEPAQKRPSKSTNGHGPAKKTKIKTRKT